MSVACFFCLRGKIKKNIRFSISTCIPIWETILNKTFVRVLQMLLYGFLKSLLILSLFYYVSGSLLPLFIYICVLRIKTYFIFPYFFVSFSLSRSRSRLMCFFQYITAFCNNTSHSLKCKPVFHHIEWFRSVYLI